MNKQKSIKHIDFKQALKDKEDERRRQISLNIIKNTKSF